MRLASMITWGDLRREPFRICFPLAVLCGLLGVNHWLAFALGWSAAYSGFYHAGLQVAYMLGFIAGFLLTALPRFSSTEPSTSLELGLLLVLWMAQPVLLSMGQWVWAQSAFAAVLVLLAVFAVRRFAKRRTAAGPPTEFVWLPMGILLGLVGSTLFVLIQWGVLPTPWLAAARPMAQQGFLLSVVLGVGGFMAPRLMGRPLLLVTPPGQSEDTARRIRRRRVLIHAGAGAALACSFVLEGAGRLPLAYALRAAVVTGELAWTTQFYRRPAVSAGYVHLLWASLWLLVIGLWGAALLSSYRAAMLHLVFLGGFSLMAFAVGTMVVFSHSGQGQRLQQPLWALRLVGSGIAMAIVARLAAEWLPQALFPLLGVAAACWSIAGLSWLWLILPLVLRPAVPVAFEQLHEEAKRRRPA